MRASQWLGPPGGGAKVAEVRGNGFGGLGMGMSGRGLPEGWGDGCGIGIGVEGAVGS